MTAGSPSPDAPDADAVVLAFGPDTANVGLARTVAAAMASRADLPLDQLEDVRLAVDEAVTQVIADCPAGATVEVRFRPAATGLAIDVCAPSSSGRPPAQDTFGWTVLSALVDSVAAEIADGVLTLRLRADRAATVEP